MCHRMDHSEVLTVCRTRVGKISPKEMSVALRRMVGWGAGWNSRLENSCDFGSMLKDELPAD